MTAAVQQGSHTAHPAWSLLSDRLTHTPTHTVPTLPEWNRLYVAKSLHLRTCCLLYEQHGTARLMFACDYRDSNGLGQLKDSNRLRAYVPELSHCVVTDLTNAQQLQLLLDSTGQTEPTAQHTESRHLCEPLIGAPFEWQVIPKLFFLTHVNERAAAACRREERGKSVRALRRIDPQTGQQRLDSSV